MSFNLKVFSVWVLAGMWHGLVGFLLCLLMFAAVAPLGGAPSSPFPANLARGRVTRS
jgi:hypothetical protein